MGIAVAVQIRVPKIATVPARETLYTSAKKYLDSEQIKNGHKRQNKNDMKKKIRLLAYLLTVMAFVGMLTNSCKKDDNNNNNQTTVTDIDGNIYHTVTIGTQIWLVENLKTTHYRNGDPIEKITTDTGWCNITKGAYCDYNNSVENGKIFGRLYNFYSVNDSRNICPNGWHVPSDEEWSILENNLGGAYYAGGKMKEIGNIHWTSPNTDADNSSGFTGLPAGDRNFLGRFADSGSYAFWWSSTTYITTLTWYRMLSYRNAELDRDYRMHIMGFSVRCIKDN